jgi:hypothetical protein
MRAVYQSSGGIGYSRQITLTGSPAEIAARVRCYANGETADTMIAVHTDAALFVANRDEQGWHFNDHSPVGRACRIEVLR